MGLFDRAKAAFGGVDHHLIEDGVLARGIVTTCEPTGMGTGRAAAGLGTRIVCKLTVQVVPLDGGAPYEAHTMHPIPQVYLPQFMSGNGAVAVRVDPADPQHVALDLTHDVPPAPEPADGAAAPPPKIVLTSDDGTQQEVKTEKGVYTTADLLARGLPCTLEVLAAFPLGQLTQAGRPATGIILQVHREGVAPYQAQAGLYVPPAATSIVVPGAKVPGKWMPGPGLPTDANLVTIDFPALGIDPNA